MTFPMIDPIAFSLGPVDVKWYGLAYFFGFIAGYGYACCLGRLSPRNISSSTLSDMLFYIILGVIIGGRFGYVVFYDLGYYIENPLQILKTWDGGMAFHGGVIGIVIAVLLFGNYRKVSPYILGDLVVSVAPIGLLVGRIANFINGELYGRVTTSSWGVVFPGAGPEPRHASQLYEAFFEGFVLLIIMTALNRLQWVRERSGFLVGVFFVYYGIARAMIELFRQPDAHIGFMIGGLTRGQLLSLPMILVGLFFLWRSIARGRNA